eukprot:541299-Prymnesium_polylepis.1
MDRQTIRRRTEPDPPRPPNLSAATTSPLSPPPHRCTPCAPPPRTGAGDRKQHDGGGGERLSRLLRANAQRQARAAEDCHRHRQAAAPADPVDHLAPRRGGRVGDEEGNRREEREPHELVVAALDAGQALLAALVAAAAHARPHPLP